MILLYGMDLIFVTAGKEVRGVREIYIPLKELHMWRLLQTATRILCDVELHNVQVRMVTSKPYKKW
jgi:hypothetical protein